MKPITQNNNLKIALVYDRVNTKFGGAEFVVTQLLSLFPDAPLFTSVYHPNAGWVDQGRIKTSWLQSIPFVRNKHQLIAGLMPLAFESLDFSNFDVVISITSAEAKGILTLPNQRHICYLLSPTRYLYKLEHYQSLPAIINLPFFSKLINIIFRYLTWWDKQAAIRPDTIITLSNQIAKEIKTTYHRKANVIFPPLKVQNKLNTSFSSYLKTFSYLTCISRLVGYKKIDLAIRSALKLKIPLIIIGAGNYSKTLQKIALPHGYIRRRNESSEAAIKNAFLKNKLIIFLNHTSEKNRLEVLQNSSVNLMLGQEDFGLVALESLSIGIPTIINDMSGVAEITKSINACIHLPNPTVKSVSIAINKAKSSKVSKKDIQKIKKQFSYNSFADKFLSVVYDT